MTGLDLTQKVADWKDCVMCLTTGKWRGRKCITCDGIGYIRVNR